jgi:hypothetical protein
MPLGDDLLAVLSNPGSPAAETVRLELNRLQAAAGRLDAIAGVPGGLDSNVFRNSGPFSILPHPCAALHRATATASGDLTVANDTWTDVAFDAFDAADNTATWARGLEIDAANGRIYVTGIDRESVVLINCWAEFEPNATGVRGVGWLSDTGDLRYQYDPSAGAALNSDASMTHLRMIKSDYTYSQMQVYQSSGGNLDCIRMYMCIVQLR